MKYILLVLIFSTVGLNSQSFPVDTIMMNGSIDSRINIVILGDGYQNFELDDFINNAKSFTKIMFEEEPFLSYESYFNVFAISTPSNVSGAADNPSNLIDNYYGSTFGYGGIQRLLVPTKNSTINLVIVNNFPQTDQVIMLVNDSRYGGSGGMVATSSTHNNAGEIVIHEIGHSFAFLADEYYAGNQYARERANMTRETNPALVKWKNWYGDYGIGIYQHCCGGNSSQWYKPHEDCKMQRLGKDFCSVCKETIVARIHTLTNPIISYFPEENSFITDLDLLNFKVNLMFPNPNTLNISWFLNNEGTADGIDSLVLDVENLNESNNRISVFVLDTVDLIRIDNYSNINIYSQTWIVDKDVSSLEVRESTSLNFNIEKIYPNPVNNNLNLKLSSIISNSTLWIADINGKTIKQVPVRANSLINISINTEDLRAGKYYFNIIKDGVIIAKGDFIKQ